MLEHLQQLLADQQNGLASYFQTIDLSSCQQLLDAIAKLRGVVFFTGVGKSGFVAEKIATTLTSTGTRALFLPPTNALHGDIGIISSQDLVVFLSKGGESDELLQMIPPLRRRGVSLFAVVSTLSSRLQRACDGTIYLPVSKELCPFGLAPTTSAIVQMLFGDLLAVALMRQRNFSLDEYALNHPAGKIGRRISWKVADLMLREGQLPLSLPGEKLLDLLVELSDKRCGCLLIADGERHLQGIFTDGDLRRALQQHGPVALDYPIEQLMSRTPKSISGEALAHEAMALMQSDPLHPVTALPVVDEARRIVGLIKLHDIVQSGL